MNHKAIDLLLYELAVGSKVVNIKREPLIDELGLVTHISEQTYAVNEISFTVDEVCHITVPIYGAAVIVIRWTNLLVEDWSPLEVIK